MIPLVHFLMLNVLLILVGSTFISKMATLCKLTSFVYPILLFVCRFFKRLMEVDSWDILDPTRPSPHSPSSTFGQRCSATWHASATNALHVAKLSQKINLMVYICHFQFRINHGRILVWISCLVCLGPKWKGFRIFCCGPILKNGTFHAMQ